MCVENGVDLGNFDLILEMKKSLMEAKGVDENVLSKELIQDFFRMIGTEIAPSAAILGGILAQEVLKIVAQNEVPISNYFGFNAQDPSGIIMSLVKE
jgi:ubiquitin-like 1-activating enzyme E1 A